MQRLPERISDITHTLSRELKKISFFPYTVYNPLEYAKLAWELYLSKLHKRPEVLFIGINPGPWGMVQSGVPFGDTVMVKHWLNIHAEIFPPSYAIPSRPVYGLSCPRREVSGRRLWELFSEHYETPAQFFSRNFVYNYCPLAFFAPSEKASNITPDRLPPAMRKLLFHYCDEALRSLLLIFLPRYIITIGNFAMKRMQQILPSLPFLPLCKKIPHPSPANPRANRGWKEEVGKLLITYRVWTNEE